MTKFQPSNQRACQFAEPSRQTGITMIEVLVTILVVAIGLLGLASMQSVSLKSNQDSIQRAAATNLAYELVSRMRANPEGARAGNYATAFANNGICNAAPTKMCTAYYGQQSGSVQLGSSCSSAELATYDAWEISCGHTNTANTFSSPVNYLMSPNIAVSCDDSNPADAMTCSANSLYTVTFNWQAIAPTAQSDNQAANTQRRQYSVTLTPFI